MAQMDKVGAAAILFQHLPRSKDGRVLGSPESGNTCTIYLRVDDTIERLVHVFDYSLTRYAWKGLIHRVIRKSEYSSRDPKIIAWLLSQHKFYVLQKGDVFLDTKSKVPRYAVVTPRRATKNRKLRRKKEKRNARRKGNRVRYRDV